MTKGIKSVEDIDRIVDDLVKDEKTAAELKGKLHQTIEEPNVAFEPEKTDDDDADDMWDNMPV